VGAEAAAVSARDVPVRRVAARGVGRLRDAVPFPATSAGRPAAPLPFGDSVEAEESTAVSGAGSVMVLLGRVIDTVLPVQHQYHQGR
jgi:hypothetical protein